MSDAATPTPASSDTSDNRAREGKSRSKPWSRERWLEVYSEKGTVTAACKAVGISRDTAYRYRKLEPDFAAAWDREEQAVTDVLEQTLVEVALDMKHPGQVRALEFALKSRRPTKYRESLKIDGKVTHVSEQRLDDEIQEYLQREREAELAGEGAATGPESAASVAPGSAPGPGAAA